jgi:hypothetical protein
MIVITLRGVPSSIAAGAGQPGDEADVLGGT